MNHRTVHTLSFAAGAVPFAFASIRAIQTGWDFRYFLIAAAGLIGAAGTVAIGGASTFVMTIAAFVAAAVLAVLAAMTIGTRLGPGLLIVAAAFAVCFAAAAFFHLRASGAPATARQ